MNVYLKYFFIALCILIQQVSLLHAKSEASYKVIVIDITNILLQTDQEQLQHEITGLKSAGFMYLLRNGNLNVEQGFYSFLDSFGKQQGDPHHVVKEPEKGHILPLILVRWLAGEIHYQELMSLIKAHTKDKIFTNIAQTVFNAKILAKHTKELPGAATFIDTCIKIVGSSNVCFVGNWDLHTFQLILQNGKHAHLFSLVPENRHFISGKIKQVLPRDMNAIFESIHKNCNCTQGDILFITAQPHHAQAAQHNGYATFLLKHQSLDHASRSLHAQMRSAR